MTKSASAYFLSLSETEDESVDEYVARWQMIVVNYLKWVRGEDKLDELSYRRLMLTTFDGTIYEQAQSHFYQLWNEVIYAVATTEEESIYARLIKGAEMIDAETDPVKRRQYLEVYASLEQRLMYLKQIKEDHKP